MVINVLYIQHYRFIFLAMTCWRPRVDRNKKQHIIFFPFEIMPMGSMIKVLSHGDKAAKPIMTTA